MSKKEKHVIFIFKKKKVFCDTVVEPFSRELLLVVRHTAFQALKHLLMFIHLCTCIYMFESCVFISYSVFRVFLFQITKVVFTWPFVPIFLKRGGEMWVLFSRKSIAYTMTRTSDAKMIYFKGSIPIHVPPLIYIHHVFRMKEVAFFQTTWLPFIFLFLLK